MCLPWKFAMFQVQGKIVHRVILFKNNVESGKKSRGTTQLAVRSLLVNTSHTVESKCFYENSYPGILHFKIFVSLLLKNATKITAISAFLCHRPMHE